MSSKARLRYARIPLLALFALTSLPALAQDTVEPSATAEDILAEAKDAYGPPPPSERCTREQDAATISGVIIVCRRLTDQSEFRTTSPDNAEKRYAEATMHQGDPQAPNVDGPGIFHGPATVGSMCIPGLQKCPPPPAIIVDFEALPEAPPGSDADRMARGLPPLGENNPVSDRPVREAIAPETETQPVTGVSPSGSALPEGRQ